jgi:large subunit ribosomal protein L9
MDIILLERIGKLGQLGDVVAVKDGYARNFLLPQGKALRATKGNLERFETGHADLIRVNDEKRGGAEAASEGLRGTSWVLIRQASESFQLYGSVSARDIANAITESGVPVTRQQVRLDATIKALGVYPVTIALHPEVEVDVTVNVARSEEEAEIQSAQPTGPRQADDVQRATPEEAAPDIEALVEETAAAEMAETIDADATDASAEASDGVPAIADEPAGEVENDADAG